MSKNDILKKRIINRPGTRNILYAVLTRREVIKRYKISHATLERAIKNKVLIEGEHYRRTEGGQLLLYAEIVHDLWGYRLVSVEYGQRYCPYCKQELPIRKFQIHHQRNGKIQRRRKCADCRKLETPRSKHFKRVLRQVSR